MTTTPYLPPLSDEIKVLSPHLRESIRTYALASYTAGRDAGLEECYHAADAVLPVLDGKQRNPVKVRNDILNAISNLKSDIKGGV